MEVRKYQRSDCKELTELFYNTVHTVNAKDYTKEQLNVWATGHLPMGCPGIQSVVLVPGLFCFVYFSRFGRVYCGKMWRG